MNPRRCVNTLLCDRWVKKAVTISWESIEEEYAELYSSETGIPAKPPRTALGSLIIQKQYGYFVRELLEQIKEYSYYHYFIGLLGYQSHQSLVPSLLVEFRKHLNDDIMMESNEMIIAYNSPNNPDWVMAVERIPIQHRTNRKTAGRLFWVQPAPCMYHENARRDYLNLAKCKKRDKNVMQGDKTAVAIHPQGHGICWSISFRWRGINAKEEGYQCFVRSMHDGSSCMRTTHIPFQTALSASASHISDELWAERQQCPWNSEQSWIWTLTKMAWRDWKNCLLMPTMS